MLRFGGTTLVEGQPVAAAVASVRIARGTLSPAAGASTEYSAPHLASLRTETAVGGVQRRALAVPAPATLSYYLEVPPSGALGFGVGVSGDKPKGAKASVVVTPEGGEPKQLFASELSASWRN